MCVVLCNGTVWFRVAWFASDLKLIYFIITYCLFHVWLFACLLIYILFITVAILTLVWFCVVRHHTPKCHGANPFRGQGTIQDATQLAIRAASGLGRHDSRPGPTSRSVTTRCDVGEWRLCNSLPAMPRDRIEYGILKNCVSVDQRRTCVKLAIQIKNKNKNKYVRSNKSV